MRNDRLQPRRAQTPPRYANPWRYRRQSPVEPVANTDGGQAASVLFRRNGQTSFMAVVYDPLKETPVPPAEESMLMELRRRVAAEIARYRASGDFSEIEIRTIEALWREGIGLRELARREGVAPQAITDRLHRIGSKAPRFKRWWQLKNRLRTAPTTAHHCTF